MSTHEHSWRFDTERLHNVCAACGEIRDAISGRMIKAGSHWRG